MDASAILVVDPQPLAMKHFFSQGGFIVDCAVVRHSPLIAIAHCFCSLLEAAQ